jgi:large subunit ribosomal protein L33
MFAKKGQRGVVILESVNASRKKISRYITTKNKLNTTYRMSLKKYNPILKRHTIHEEIK